MDELSRWEGQNPSLAPPPPPHGPSSEGGASASTSGWVDVGPGGEVEGHVPYPKQYSPAAVAQGSESDEGVVAYPQVPLPRPRPPPVQAEAPVLAGNSS